VNITCIQAFHILNISHVHALCHRAIPKLQQHTLVITIHVVPSVPRTQQPDTPSLRQVPMPCLGSSSLAIIHACSAPCKMLLRYKLSDIRLSGRSMHCCLLQSTDAYKLASPKCDELGRTPAFGQVGPVRFPRDQALACWSLLATILGMRT
jgi:hypothetical protein